MIDKKGTAKKLLLLLILCCVLLSDVPAQGLDTTDFFSAECW
jgi:hypothetical protein